MSLINSDLSFTIHSSADNNFEATLLLQSRQDSRHATANDVFDDVIEDVLARGVIGDEADSCRVRGGFG